MNDSDSPWEIISSEYLHKAPWLTVRKDHVVLPNGNHIPSYYILEYPDWVNTIAITRDGQFVFIRQYRHGLQETSYELCAGVCEEEDASPLISAQRELLEETGYGNGTWQEYMQISPNPSTHTNITYCFLATDVEKISEQHLEDTESLSVHLLTLAEVKGAAAKRRDKASADGRSIVEIYSRERTIIRLPLYSNGLRNVQPPFHSEQP